MRDYTCLTLTDVSALAPKNILSMLRMELVWGYNARLVYNSQVLAFCAVKVEF